MFERDKAELRDLGIPLETGKVSNVDPGEGYRIKHDAYALPDIDLTREEAAAVAVATKLWESPERITAAQSAVLKLRAAGVDVDPAAGVAISTGAGPAGLIAGPTNRMVTCFRGLRAHGAGASRSGFRAHP